MLGSSKSTFVTVPFLLLGLAAPGLDGGASPVERPSGLPMRVSPASVQFGKSVRITGLSKVPAGSLIRLSLRTGPGIAVVVKSVRANRRGGWSATYAPRRSGTFNAESTSPQSRVASGSKSASIHVRPLISVDPVGLSVNGKPTVGHFRILPQTKAPVQIERKVGKRWVTVNSVHPRPTGKTSFRIKAGVSGAFRLRVNSQVGFDPAVAGFSVSKLRPALASWYGLYGDPIACGGVLHAGTVGVAHKTLPCGTKVTIRYRGRTIVAPVIDRGPYIAGREYDLSGAAARALHFDGVDTIWVSR